MLWIHESKIHYKGLKPCKGECQHSKVFCMFASHCNFHREYVEIQICITLILWSNILNDSIFLVWNKYAKNK